MTPRFNLLCLLVILATSTGSAQSDFRAVYSGTNPVPKGSTLSWEEKIAAHQAYLNKAIQNKDSLQQLCGYLFLFIDYGRTQDYPSATSQLLKAEAIAKASGRADWLGFVCYRKGILYLSLKEYEQAITETKQAVELCGVGGDSLCVAESLEQLSALYNQLNDFDEAKRYYQLALPLLERFGDEMSIAISISNYGIMLSHQERPAEAIPYIERAIVLLNKLGKNRDEARALNNLGDAYARLGRYDLAAATFERCLKINTDLKDASNLLSTYDNLSSVYKEKGNYRLAFDYLSQYHTLRDSIIGAETKEKIATLELQYESQQKELALEKSQAALSAAKNKMTIGALVFLLVLLFVGFGIWRWRTQIHQAKVELAKNKDNLNKITRLLLEKNTKLSELEAKVAARTVSDDISALTTKFEQNLYSQHVLTEADWAAFKIYFEKAHPGYLNRVRTTWPSLTDAEERLFLFIKLNLNRKEAASILGISADSVKKTRNRLRKRLELDDQVDLDGFIHDF